MGGRVVGLSHTVRLAGAGVGGADALIRHAGSSWPKTLHNVALGVASIQGNEMEEARHLGLKKCSVL